jgi:hypothetical protein
MASASHREVPGELPQDLAHLGRLLDRGFVDPIEIGSLT